MKKIICLILVVFALSSASPAWAAPMLKFNPSSGTYTNGSTFTVTVGVDSGTEKSSAVDIWGTFDSGKLEVVSIDSAASPAFPFIMGKNISEGKFDVSCTSTDLSTFGTAVLNGDLVVITFRAKATGTASVNFSCQQGSDVDSNIFNEVAVDVISCAANQNGSYTITEGGNDTPVNPTAVPTPGSSASTQSNSLPQTGNAATTIGLLVFGLVGILSSWALRFL